MAKENDITSIRIPKSVKADLKEVALEKEPYHATIQRLMNENQQLKKANANSEYLIDLMKTNTQHINIFYTGWEYLHQVIEQYKTDSNKVYRLVEVANIQDIIASDDKSYDEKVDALQDAFNSTEDKESFVDGLNYLLAESEYYNHTSDEELIIDFVEYMLKNNPYDKSTKEYQEYVALFNMIG